MVSSKDYQKFHYNAFNKYKRITFEYMFKNY